MPVATSSASVRPPASAPPAAQARREKGHAEVADRDAEQDEAGAAETTRQQRLPVERLDERLDAEEGEQAGGQRHERGEPLGARAPQRRQPEQAERDRDDADEEADDPVAEEALRRRASASRPRRRSPSSSRYRSSS